MYLYTIYYVYNTDEYMMRNTIRRVFIIMLYGLDNDARLTHTVNCYYSYYIVSHV